MHFKVLNYSWDRVSVQYSNTLDCPATMLFINSLCSICTSLCLFYQLMCAALCVDVVFAHAFVCLFRNLLFFFLRLFRRPSVVSRKHETTRAPCEHARANLFAGMRERRREGCVTQSIAA